MTKTLLKNGWKLFGIKFDIVAGLGVEPSLRDYEPRVHRTLSRVVSLKFYLKSKIL